jgi:hypothetical protein
MQEDGLVREPDVAMDVAMAGEDISAVSIARAEYVIRKGVRRGRDGV